MCDHLKVVSLKIVLRVCTNMSNKCFSVFTVHEFGVRLTSSCVNSHCGFIMCSVGA